MKRLFFALAATILRAVSWWPFGWIAERLSAAARWCEARS